MWVSTGQANSDQSMLVGGSRNRFGEISSSSPERNKTRKPYRVHLPKPLFCETALDNGGQHRWEQLLATHTHRIDVKGALSVSKARNWKAISTPSGFSGTDAKLQPRQQWNSKLECAAK